MYNASGNKMTLFVGGNTLPGTGSNITAFRAYATMGSGLTVSLTVAGGVISACTPSGGSGYVANGPPPIVIAVTGTAGSTPAVHLTGYAGGTFATCAIDNNGTSGITAATATLNPNEFNIYAMAKTYQVYNASTGTVDGTFWTNPFAGTVNVGDAVEQPHYFLQNARLDNVQEGTLIPNTMNNNLGRGVTLVGTAQGADYAIGFNNNADPRLYYGYIGGTPWMQGYGQIFAPVGVSQYGQFSDGHIMLYPPTPGSTGFSGFGFGVGCGTLGCAAYTSPYKFLAALGNGGTDALNYTPYSRTWALGGAEVDISLTSGCTYKWTSTGTTTSGTCSAGSVNLATVPISGTGQTYNLGTLVFPSSSKQLTLHFVGLESDFPGVSTDGSSSDVVVSISGGNGGTPNLSSVVGKVQGSPGFVSNVIAVETDGGSVSTNLSWTIYAAINGTGNYTVQAYPGTTWTQAGTASTIPSGSSLAWTGYQQVGQNGSTYSQGMNAQKAYGNLNFIALPTVTQPLIANELDGNGTYTTGTPYYFTFALASDPVCSMTGITGTAHETTWTPSGSNPSVILSIGRYQILTGAAAWLIGEGTSSGGETKFACVPFPQGVYQSNAYGSPSGAMPATDTTQGSIKYNGAAPATTVNGQACALGGTCTLPLPLSGTTGSIGGSALTVGGACATGTASVTGAVVGKNAMATRSDGALIGPNYKVDASVTSSGTVTVEECAIVAGTPSAVTFNVNVAQQ
jgi:hypothetical protein